jgi:Family of unknown function (DUF6441)
VTITQTYDGAKLGQKFAAQVNRFAANSTTAARTATQRAANEIVQQGRANIAASGSSAHLQEGLNATLTAKSRTAIAIRVTHSVPYWPQFEEGRVIHGKPLLWIPLSFAPQAQHVRARNFPGPLVQVDRPGKAPLLLTTGGRPMYFGKTTITIKKRWNLREIVRQVTDQMNQFYKEALQGGR